MDWRLMDYAKEAEETANGLLGFEDEIPQYRKDIRGHMAELYAISHALHSLHDALKPTEYGRYATYIMKDVEVCLPSLGYTLDEIQDIFGKSKKSRHTAPGAFPGTPPYALIWEDALADFRLQGMSLPQRFETVRMYLQGMLDALKGIDNVAELANYKVSLSKLLKKQQPAGSYFSELPVQGVGKSSARTPKPASPKVPRPKIRSHPTYPAPPYLGYQPSSPPLPHRAHIAPTWGGIGIGEVPFVPPAAPEIPQSPTYSSASSQAFSNQSTDSETVAHWAMKIFDGRYGMTPFQTLGEPSECFGRDEPRVLKMLEEDRFEGVVELSFEAMEVWVKMYWRAEDNRARILVLATEPDGRRVKYQIPITALALRRAGSCLQLCRANRRDGKLDLWARLRFPTYERMVLFYCTAVAMKRQDQTVVAEELMDIFGSEELLFGGEITDHGALFAFRVFYDRDSRCVRFEATARRGPMNTTPIWTAFVTQYYRRADWIKRVAPDTIQFEKLHLYMFCDSYKLHKGPTGKYRLKFTTPEDAKQLRECLTR